MLHALLATIGTLAILVSIVVKLVVRPADAAESQAIERTERRWNDIPIYEGPCRRAHHHRRGWRR
jgi:hypothetical protein